MSDITFDVEPARGDDITFDVEPERGEDITFDIDPNGGGTIDTSNLAKLDESNVWTAAPQFMDGDITPIPVGDIGPSDEVTKILIHRNGDDEELASFWATAIDFGGGNVIQSEGFRFRAIGESGPTGQWIYLTSDPFGFRAVITEGPAISDLFSPSAITWAVADPEADQDATPRSWVRNALDSDIKSNSALIPEAEAPTQWLACGHGTDWWETPWALQSPTHTLRIRALFRLLAVEEGSSPYSYPEVASESLDGIGSADRYEVAPRFDPETGQVVNFAEGTAPGDSQEWQLEHPNDADPLAPYRAGVWGEYEWVYDFDAHHIEFRVRDEAGWNHEDPDDGTHWRTLGFYANDAITGLHASNEYPSWIGRGEGTLQVARVRRYVDDVLVSDVDASTGSPGATTVYDSAADTNWTANGSAVVAAAPPAGYALPAGFDRSDGGAVAPTVGVLEVTDNGSFTLPTLTRTDSTQLLCLNVVASGASLASVVVYGTGVVSDYALTNGNVVWLYWYPYGDPFWVLLSDMPRDGGSGGGGGSVAWPAGVDWIGESTTIDASKGTYYVYGSDVTVTVDMGAAPGEGTSFWIITDSGTGNTLALSSGWVWRVAVGDTVATYDLPPYSRILVEKLDGGYGVTHDSSIGALSNDLPQAPGTPNAGESNGAARADHVHEPPTAGQIGAATSSDISTAISDHAGAADPHGDRAYTDTGLAGKADASRLISAGTGLTGGGSLAADRTLAVSYGTTAGTAAQGNDSRLSDSRTPTSHASSHAAAGSDPLTISESQVTNLTTDLAAKVPTTRTINGYDLSANRSLTASDVSALPSSTVLPWENSITISCSLRRPNTIGSTYTRTTSAVLGGGYAAGATTNNGESWTYTLNLRAGTWTIEWIIRKHAAGGIITPTLGGSSLTTVDTYNGSTSGDQVVSQTGITVSSDGRIDLVLTNPTKNASSSAYGWTIQAIVLTRTGS